MYKVMCIPALAVLAGCGGSSDVISHDLTVTQTVQQTFASESRIAPLPLTDEADLPVNRTVEYTGSAAVFRDELAPGGGTDRTFTGLGTATLTVDFGTASMSGQATDFYQLTNLDEVSTLPGGFRNASNFEGTAVSGTINLSLDGTDGVGSNIYSGSADGVIFAEGVDPVTFGDGQNTIFAGVSGTDAEAVYGRGFEDDGSTRTNIEIITFDD